VYKKISSEASQSGVGSQGVQVQGDLRASSLQRNITRKYPQILTMMDFVRQQKNNAFCMLYALNNVIQCSPYLFDRRAYTVEDMVYACNQIYPTPRETCNEKGGFTLAAVRWLLTNHPYSHPKTPQEDRGLLLHESKFLRKEIFSRQTALAELESKVMTIGFLCLLSYKGRESKHAIAIVNLQPLTLETVNFVVIDSNLEFIVVSSSYDDLIKYLDQYYKLHSVYVDEAGNSIQYTQILVIKKSINDNVVQELKSLHEESQTPLEAGYSYYQF
jgi:hypothetical protein